MKKSLILLSICSAVLLSSCGTSSYYAYSTFDDGIYYRTSKEDRKNIEADNAEVQGLIEQTRQEAARFSDTILLAGTNTVQSITSAATATAVPVNINIDNYYDYNLLGYDTYCSYWDWKYWDIFGPWGRYSSWYDWYNWYSPWFPGIYDPWYPSWGWSWSFAWNSWGWYGPAGWWGGYWDPWYYPWGYPVAGHAQPSYYGKRNTGVRSGAIGTAGINSSRTLASGTTVRRNTAGADRAEARPSISLTRGRDAKPSAVRTTAKIATGTLQSGRTTLTAGNTATSIRTQGNRLNLGEKYVQNGFTVSGETGRAAFTARTVNSQGQPAYRRSAINTEFRNPFGNSENGNTGSGITAGYRKASGLDTDQSFEINRNSFNRNSFNNNNNSSRTVNSSISRSVSTRSSAGSVSRSFSGGGSRSGGGSTRSVRR